MLYDLESADRKGSAAEVLVAAGAAPAWVAVGQFDGLRLLPFPVLDTCVLATLELAAWVVLVAAGVVVVPFVEVVALLEAEALVCATHDLRTRVVPTMALLKFDVSESSLALFKRLWRRWCRLNDAPSVCAATEAMTAKMATKRGRSAVIEVRRENIACGINEWRWPGGEEGVSTSGAATTLSAVVALF